jgi:succinate dehydrogenase / fumarate reductase cytochrome b subunit
MFHFLTSSLYLNSKNNKTQTVKKTRNMSWFSNFSNSSIGNKVLISLTGLFLSLFLVVHLAGNLQLLVDDGGVAFNSYSDVMSSNLLIKVVALALYAAIIAHAVKGILIYVKNRRARGNIKYAVKSSSKSSWASRNMALLGSLLFIFIAIHMGHFWFKFKFGYMENHPDLTHYDVVVTGFKQSWIVAFYVLAQIALGYHLLHGFQSAFQTLGIRKGKYTKLIQNIGVVFSIIVPLAFAVIPVLVYLDIYPLGAFTVIPGQPLEAMH